MTKALWVLVAAFLSCLVALVCFVPPTDARKDQSFESVNAGVIARLENDYFLRSLMAIYKDRYVPGSVDAGHFSISQAGASRRGIVDPEKTVQRPVKGDKPITVVGLVNGTVVVDPDADLAPQQRQIGPDVALMVGPAQIDTDLRDLPYRPPTPEETDERPLRRHPEILSSSTGVDDPFSAPRAPASPQAMPTPAQSFLGVTSVTSGCACLPPDTDGDIGPSHYIQAVNSSFQIFTKTGTSLSGPTTFNSFFAPLGPTTPCGTGNQNRGDPMTFYDHIADRWVISDFAYVTFPGALFYQCIGVSKTSDPVAGGWWLYAIQVDAGNPTHLGDYPKFGMWPDAYYMSVNKFSNSTTFEGVRVFAFDRAAMLTGGAANTVAFNILPADLGDEYSLQPASFRTGLAPPAGRPNMFLSIGSPAGAGVVQTQVFVRRFHVDFTTPANSTFGTGAAHGPDGTVTVSGFVDAFTGAGTTTLVPQPTTTAKLDTLGDKIMYPVIYQGRGGVESLYAAHTINNNQNGTGPSAIRWYQFNVTGNTIPATPLQEQTFNNGADGIWRFMPSINVDRLGNLAIGYAASSSTVEPSIRWAGRLVADAPNTLGQGEAVMQVGEGHQTSTSGRWGDYSSMFVDPSDGCTFYHTNEYFQATSASAWSTRVGSFRFPGCVISTAATVSIAGRVLTSQGAGLRNTVVTIRDQNGIVRTAVTSAFGYYSFADVELGNYLVSVGSRRYAYPSRLVSVTDSMSDLDFVP